jgi:hypothetical protein
MFIGIIALIISTGPCLSLDFKELTAHPDAYKGKCVSVKGVAAVDGPSFTLWQPPKRELRIFVGQRLGKPKYNALNNRWVRITGFADVDDRGIFACKVFLTSVKALPGSPLPDIKTYGVFHNDGPTTVRILVTSKANNEEIEMTLSPRETHRLVVVEGVAQVYDSSNKVISKCIVPSADFAHGSLERATRNLYFRVSHGKIVLVSPAQAFDIKNY